MELGGSRFISIEISIDVSGNGCSMEINLLLSNYSVEVDLLPWKFSKWNLPLFPSIAASANNFPCSFYELPCTPAYFHLIPWVPKTSGCIRKTFVGFTEFRSIYFHVIFH